MIIIYLKSILNMKYHSRACNAYTSLTLHCSHHACWKRSPIVWNHLKTQLPHCPFVHIYIYTLMAKTNIKKGMWRYSTLYSYIPPILISSSRNRVTHYYFIFKCIEFIKLTENITCLFYHQNPGRPMRGHEAKYIH